VRNLPYGELFPGDGPAAWRLSVGDRAKVFITRGKLMKRHIGPAMVVIAFGAVALTAPNRADAFFFCHVNFEAACFADHPPASASRAPSA
jgi:hypothetical protein